MRGGAEGFHVKSRLFMVPPACSPHSLQRGEHFSGFRSYKSGKVRGHESI